MQESLVPVLARIQFAANISFHILFPTISLALAWVLVFFKSRYNKSHAKYWIKAYRFWVKVFALTFALGVVSGITMSFQFGTNWPGFMEKVGNIAGPLLSYEVLSAFFLEATFLGIMLFGSRRVSNRIHNIATLLVAIGTTLSAFWILSLNSWMQTPTGYEIIDGVAHAKDWLAIVFNPSLPYRFTHMMLASCFTVGFLLAGLSAYKILRGSTCLSVRKTLKTGIILAAIVTPIQIISGDALGLNTVEHQPAKIAAIEGVWHTEKSAPLVLFAIPNAKTQQNDYAIEVPYLGSLLLTHKLDGELKGINEFNGEHPAVKPVFFAFRVMVGTGVIALLVSWVGMIIFRKCEYVVNLAKRNHRFLLRVLVGTTFIGWLGTLSGWYVTEIGRQPWLIYGLYKTYEAATKVPAHKVGFATALYIITYLFMLIAYITTLFYIARNEKSLPKKKLIKNK